MTLLSSLAGGAASPAGSLSVTATISSPALLEVGGDFHVRTGATLTGLSKATRNRIAAKSTDFMAPCHYSLLGGSQVFYGTSLVYGNGVYLRGTGNGLLRSTDGVAWSPVEVHSSFINSSSSLQLGGANVTFGGGLFVMAVNHSISKTFTVLTSADGLTWTLSRIYSPGANPDSSAGVPVVSYANGAFFIGVKMYDSAGNYYYDQIWRSADGLTWSGVAQFQSFQTAVTGGVAVVYGGGTYVAMTANGGGAGLSYYYTSSNGTSWTQQTATSSLTDGVNSLRYLNGLWVAITGKATTTTQIYTSANATTWTPRTSSTAVTFYDVAYGAGLYVAVGGGGVINTSPDGVTWTQRTSNAGASGIAAVQYDATLGLFMALHATGVTTSTDGITWTNTAISYGGRSTACNVASNVLAKLNGTWYAAAGAQEGIFSSTNGTTWTPVLNLGPLAASGQSAINRRLATDNAMMVAGDLLFLCPSNGTLIASPTSSLAFSTRIASTVVWTSVAYGAGLYVAVGGGGNIQTSPDGVTWTARTSGTATNLVGIVWTGAEFIALSSSYTARSTDGVSWASVSMSGYTQIAYSDGRVYMLGSSVLAVSATGVAGTWASVSTPAGYTLMKPFSGGVMLFGGSSTGCAVCLTGGTTYTLQSGLTITDMTEVGGTLLIVSNGGQQYLCSAPYTGIAGSYSVGDGSSDVEFTTPLSNLDNTTGTNTVLYRIGSGAQTVFGVGSATSGCLWALTNWMTTSPLNANSLATSSSCAVDLGQTLLVSSSGVVVFHKTAVTAMFPRVGVYMSAGTSNATGSGNPSYPGHCYYRKIT